ncbi:MAG TPA: hypothetical protein VNB49_07685 [Candidatus Dormibacteraeota bacterium]|nr:hypothetical protein [Candidatus Dormibacteraeota bacterium]
MFACRLHAEELTRVTPGPALAAITSVRSEGEVRLGPTEAATVRRYKEPFLRQALTPPAVRIHTKPLAKHA